jgi:hypothetical protein
MSLAPNDVVVLVTPDPMLLQSTTSDAPNPDRVRVEYPPRYSAMSRFPVRIPTCVVVAVERGRALTR